jgi:hypothetical protein
MRIAQPCAPFPLTLWSPPLRSSCPSSFIMTSGNGVRLGASFMRGPRLSHVLGDMNHSALLTFRLRSESWSSPDVFPPRREKLFIGVQLPIIGLMNSVHIHRSVLDIVPSPFEFSHCLNDQDHGTVRRAHCPSRARPRGRRLTVRRVVGMGWDG